MKRLLSGRILGAFLIPVVALLSFPGLLADCGGPPPLPKALVFGDSNSGLIGEGLKADGRWDVLNEWRGQCSLLGGNHVTPDDGGTDAPASYKALECDDWRNRLQADVDANQPNYVVVNVGAIDLLVRDGAQPAPGPAWRQAVRDVVRIGSSRGARVIWIGLGRFYPADSGTTKDGSSTLPCAPYYASDFAPDGLTSWTDLRVQQENADVQASGAGGLDYRDLYGWSPHRDDCLHYVSDYQAIASWIVDGTV